MGGAAESWIEAGRGRTIDEIDAAGPALPWQVRQPGQQDRLDQAALWVRFTVELRDSERWYFVVDSSGIDRVQLFHRGPGGRWVVEEAGDSRPVSEWPVPGRVPTFELARQGGPTTYWARIEHDRVDFAAPLLLHSQPQLLAMREREQFLFGAYFGVAMLLALVSVANALLWGDRNFAAYALYLILFTLGQAAYLGVGAQHLWDRWLDWNAQSTFLLPGLSAAAALWFVQVVTEPARFSRRLNLAVLALIGLLLAAQVLDTLVPSRATFGARLLLTSAALGLVAVLVGLVWRKGDDPDIRVIALGFLPVLVMAVFPILRGLNVIPNSIVTRYGLAIGAALEMPILFYALNLRASRRREAQQRATALPHTDALTGLANRRSLVQRLDAAMARARNQKRPCALLLVRVANAEALLGEHGRDTLDRALVVTASHLRRAATDIDLAARIGEREFALLVEGPTTPDLATARAQQLVASGLRPVQALPADVTLRLLVVITLLPDQAPDAEATLQWVQGALGGIRNDSRKQIRALNF
nr:MULTISPECIES: 7TM diverse intracellular signaling domain-containing protein [Ramlibacter]